MRYKPFIKECCEAVAEAGGQENDILLVHLVKLQCIVEEIRLGGLWDSVLLGESHAPKAPIGVYVKAFQAELQSFKNSLPLDLQQDRQ